MKYEELNLHAEECIRKKINCPLECGKEIDSYENGIKHFNKTCLNALKECQKCGEFDSRKN